jgi:uncharacterized membrane protein
VSLPWRTLINTSNQPEKISMRWHYLALPLGALVLSLIAIAVFYSRLPADVTYHFSGGEPDRTVARGVFLLWMTVPHIIFLLMAFMITRMLMASARYMPSGETPLAHMIPLMSNLAGLPQLVLFVIMLQISLYNAYNVGIIPLWIIPVVILAAGAVFLVMMFLRINSKFRKNKTKNIQE